MIDTHFHKHRKSFSQTFPFLQYRDGRYEIVAEGNAALLDAYLDAAGVESYLEPGCQRIGDKNHVYGKSITDPCLGWDESERLIYDIAALC